MSSFSLDNIAIVSVLSMLLIGVATVSGISLKNFIYRKTSTSVDNIV